MFQTIRAKLIITFTTIVLLTVTTSLMAIFLLSATDSLTNTITEVDIPIVVNTHSLSVSAKGIAAAVQSLAVAENEKELRMVNDEIENLLAELDIVVSGFPEHLSAQSDQQLAKVQSSVLEFTPLLNAIYSDRLRIIGLRNVLSARNREAEVLADIVHKELEPIKASAGFNLSLTFLEMSNSPLSEAEFWRKQAFRTDMPNFQYSIEMGLNVQRINSQIHLATEAATIPILGHQQEVFYQTIEELDQDLRKFGSKGVIQSLKEPLEALKAIGLGVQGVFNLREEELMTQDNIRASIQQADRVASELTLAANDFSDLIINSAHDSSEQVHQFTQTGKFLAIVMALITTVIAFMFGWRVVSRNIAQRISNLQLQMIEGRKGNLDLDIDLSGSDEIADMSKALSFYITQMRDDIEQRKQSEQRIHQAMQRAESASLAKTKFLANMSHELRTPLNSILGYSQLMQRNAFIKDTQRNYLDIISRSGEHLLRLINEVLDLSKIESGNITLQYENFDLHSFMRELEAMFRLQTSAKSLSMDLTGLDSIPQFIKSDKNKLKQVLINILGNAVKYTNRGGIHISLERANTLNSNFDLTICIRDSGIGIAQSDLNYIFDQFKQIKSDPESANSSSGLGLTISRNFVQLMGGQIAVDSEPNEGSVFRVTIPVSEAAAKTYPEPRPRRILGLNPDGTVPRVLVVEDKMESRELLVNLLKSTGFRVRAAENGKQAIEVYNSWFPDFIWMDIRMPVMNGLEATNKIRATEKGKQTAIVALTAHALEEERENILAAGCDDVLIKPYREHEVFASMANLLSVEYVYEEQEDIQGSTKSHNKLDATQLTSLGPELCFELQEAALNLDADKLLATIKSIPEAHQSIASQLRELHRNYDFGILLELLDAVEK